MAYKPTKYFLNQCANGGLYVSKHSMNQLYYMTPQILYCVPTKRMRITKKGVFDGAICITINDEILRIVKIKNRKGYNRDYDYRKKRV